MKFHIAAGALVLFACGAVVSAFAQSTARVYVDSRGFPADASGWYPSVSPDSRWITFESQSTNLVPPVPTTPYGVYRIYVHDRQTGTTTRESVSSSGELANAQSHNSSISDDGRLVVFTTYATNLSLLVSTPAPHVYLRDRVAATTELVAPGGQGRVSGDGQLVFFASADPDLVPGDENGVADAFAYEIDGGAVSLVSVSSAGVQGDAVSSGAHPSRDGRFVAFTSDATNLVPKDTNGVRDIFFRDRVLGRTVRVSVGPGGAQANGASGLASISADGRRVVFRSDATNLVAADTNGAPDVFVHDLETGATTLVSATPTGGVGNGPSGGGSISDDGTRVAFVSGADDLVAGDSNGEADVFLRDLETGITSIASLGATGGQAKAASADHAISGDGQHVVFASLAKGLVPGFKAAAWDLLVRDLDESGPMSAYCTGSASLCLPRICTAGSPRLSGFDSFRVNAVLALVDQTGLFFWGLSPASTPFQGGTLCVKGPLVRTPLQSSGTYPNPYSCFGTYSFPFSQEYMTEHHLTAGTTIYGQYLSKGGMAGSTAALSRAIQFTICP